MIKQTINALVVSLLVGSVAPVLAQNALDSMGNPGTQGGFGHSSWKGTETNKDYDHLAAPGNANLAPQGWADFTSTNGAGSLNGPDLRGTFAQFSGPGGSSGAASSAPFAGTFTAPGNFALKNMGRSTLPPTRLESFVRNSGMNDAIYGDEGESGLPPYFGFGEGHRIERGINSPELSTGHKSDAPSAWGYPH